MALVKTTRLAKQSAGALQHDPEAKTAVSQITVARRAQERTRARQQKAAERIGAATEELASGMSEAAAAAEELRRALEQISAGAEEAAGAAQQSLAAIDTLSASFSQARTEAETSRRRTEALQTSVLESAAQLQDSAATIEYVASQQLASVDMIAGLESQAEGVGATTQMVADISDRTNLLALNAAIEAARAGDTGRGFAVVADEVRGLAEVAERSAREIETLSTNIVSEVRHLGERIRASSQAAIKQASNAQAMTEHLARVRGDLVGLAESSQAILTAAIEADIAAREATRGAEQVASAAEEQSAAVAEAQRAVQQQAQSLDESQQAAIALATLAEDLQASGTVIGGSDQVSSAAEELSATVQELSGAAGEILIAIDQISRGALAQAAATQQTNAAMVQIERGAGVTQGVSRETNERTRAISERLAKVQGGVTDIISGFSTSVEDVRASLATLDTLEDSARRIEKSIDRIVLVAVQTSMLAVSGSVEAARAGNVGRGFAIVSADIRKLAQDTSENIEGVKDVVRLMQLQIAAVRRDLELVRSTSGAELTKNAGILERMKAIETEMATIARGNQETLSGADAALAASRDVRTGAEQIATAAQQATSAAAQAATAARQQSRGAEDLAAAIEEIASLADELQLANS